MKLVSSKINLIPVMSDPAVTMSGVVGVARPSIIVPPTVSTIKL